ncbi:cell division protein ZapB [candidate division KSB1 bacterium]
MNDELIGRLESGIGKAVDRIKSLKQERENLTGQIDKLNRKLSDMEAEMSRLQQSPTAAAAGAVSSADTDKVRNRIKSMLNRLDNLNLDN